METCGTMQKTWQHSIVHFFGKWYYPVRIDTHCGCCDVVDPVIVQSRGANGKNGHFKLRGPLAPRLRKCRDVFSRKSWSHP